MQYKYVLDKQNYEDFAAGRVILSQSSMTSFPVRLASEIFQRCASLFPAPQRLRVYDPCCGGGYLLTILGFLHSNNIASLYASDINPDSACLASDNLRLLSADGLSARCASLQNLARTYNKMSHHDALHSLERLRKFLPTQPLSTLTWVGDAFQQTVTSRTIDLMICDVPYGDISTWQTEHQDNLVSRLLEAQYNCLVRAGITVVISSKKQRATYPRYARLQEETIGKRRILILQKTAC